MSLMRPRCTDCGNVAQRPVLRSDASEGQMCGDLPGGYDWLCCDCEYLRDNPEAPLVSHPRNSRQVPPQAERLFDLS